MGGNKPNFSNPNRAGATSFGMASENFGYSSLRLKRVKKLQFGVVNPDHLVSLVIRHLQHGHLCIFICIGAYLVTFVSNCLFVD